MTHYMICSTVRSGSTLLCKTLESLGGFGYPEEYFLTYETLVASFTEEITNVIAYLDKDVSNPQQYSRVPVSMPTPRQSNITNQRFIHYYQRMPKPLSQLLHRLYRQLKPVPYGEAS